MYLYADIRWVAREWASNDSGLSTLTVTALLS